MKILESTFGNIMDLCVTHNTKIKEKRERQPNWTEAEKQLLLTLTRMHQVVLENKGSDTMTIKRKSEAWDDIATNMRAAGYQRSKERLKQQLGRIRAAEAKKAKDALAKEITQSSDLAATSFPLDTATIPLSQQNNQSMPAPLQEIAIKIEKAISLADFESSMENPRIKDQKDLSGFLQTNSSSPSADIPEFNKRHCSGPQLFDVNPLLIRAEGRGPEVGESERQLPNDLFLRNNNCKCHSSGKKFRHVRFRISGYSPRTRAQRVRQLHLYRVAVEKERLKMLRMQQKRDRIFYQKDKQIQNLKLQILRNLAVNRINQINFT